MRELNRVLSSYGTTIFTTMSALAVQEGAINLGQGFPDGEGPDDIREAAAKALLEGPNQYPPSAGIPELRQAVAAHNKRFYDLDVDWREETMVTSGATEALTGALLALLNPGDEAILLEPMYDCYLPIIELAGATARPVRLEPPNWELPREAFAEAFTEQTKVVVLNSPMNPTGKVFDLEELSFIAGLLTDHDAYAICDEVYEHIVFDGRSHVPLMTLPGMRERCVRVGSAGKTFSLTGWKIGYVTADARLMRVLMKSHQYLTFTTAPNLQRAVAYGLGKEDAYFRSLAGDLEKKRDRLAIGLRQVGFDVLPCHGTYFITADFGLLGYNGDDDAFCRYITKEAKVAAVPVTAFQTDNATGARGSTKLARFCFCKDDAVLDEAIERLRTHLGS